MVFRVPVQVRRVACALAVVVYLLPSTLSAFALVGHGVAHLVEQGREQHRIAVSLGLTHESPQGQATRLPRQEALKAPTSDAVVHTHGGTTHVHQGAVGDLVRITERSDGDLTDGSAVVGSLAGHLPAAVSVAPQAFMVAAPDFAATQSVAIHPELRLQLPPPRA